VQVLGGLREGQQSWGPDAAERPRVKQATVHSASIDESSTS
jgi:hypothetical protein